MEERRDRFGLREQNGSVFFEVYVQPRATRTRLAGEYQGALRLRLTAPPVDGAANEACIAVLAELLGVAGGRVRITHGHRGRRKTIAIAGATVAEICTRLSLLVD